MEDARKAFETEYLRIKNMLSQEISENYVTLKEELFKGSSFYEIGPWIIIEILSNSEDENSRTLASCCLDAVSEGRMVKDEEILKVLKLALNISDNYFEEYLVNVFLK